MCHWPIAAQTLRRLNDELDDLTWELQSLTESFESRLPSARRGHIDSVLKRASRRRQWIRSVLREMQESRSESEDAFAALVSPRA
jgi:hypothetical protein